MANSLKGRDVLSVADLTQDEIYHVLSKAIELKRLLRSGYAHRYLEGKTVALIFYKPSTRTRVSFETGISQLGAHPLYLNVNDLQLGRGESIEDTGKVLSRYVDAIVIRTFSQREIKALAKASDVPVINGLTDEQHPCQVLADLMTILETKERLAGLKLAYLGDGNNVANSLILSAPKVNMSISVATPAGYEPKDAIVKAAEREITSPTCKVEVTNRPKQALRNADIIYTDVWVSMGQEEEREERMTAFRPFQVNSEMVSQAKSNAIIMHCLPAHRDEEITGEVIDSPNSVIFDQAENRLHVQKALLMLQLG
jgi:ornithine carbamoyltransferase